MRNQYDLSMLCKCKLVDLGHAADLIWWIFQNDNGKEYSLHTQCSWRIILNDCQIMSRDYVYYKTETTNTSLFECHIENVMAEMQKHTVENVLISAQNDIKITLDYGLIIEIFSDQPNSYEQWRFFSKGNELPHLVAYSDHQEFQ